MNDHYKRYDKAWDAMDPLYSCKITSDLICKLERDGDFTTSDGKQAKYVGKCMHGCFISAIVDGEPTIMHFSHATDAKPIPPDPSDPFPAPKTVGILKRIEGAALGSGSSHIKLGRWSWFELNSALEGKDRISTDWNNFVLNIEGRDVICVWDESVPPTEIRT